MHSFKTSDGVSHQINISIGSARAVKSQLGVDLVNADKPREGSQVPVITELYLDTELLASTIYHLLAAYDPAVKAMSQLDFEILFDGPTFDEAHTAFFEALKDFFRSTRRPALADVIDEQAKIVRVTAETQQKQLAKLNLSARAIAEVERSFGEVFTSTPESSEVSISTK